MSLDRIGPPAKGWGRGPNMASAAISSSLADYRVEVGGAREQAYEPKLSISHCSAATATAPTGVNGTFRATAVTASPIPRCAIWQIRQAGSCRPSSCPCVVTSRKKTNENTASTNASGLAKRFKRRCSVAFIPSFDSNAKYSGERNVCYPLILRCVFLQYGSQITPGPAHLAGPGTPMQPVQLYLAFLLAASAASFNWLFTCSNNSLAFAACPFMSHSLAS